MTSEDRSLEVDFSRISNDNIIPFGKYRGMPVEVLADDPEYVEWLQAQPWFRARYQKIHTRVFHNFREPDETPAHNLIQARFLDQEFMRKMFLGIQHARASESQSIKRLFDISEEKKDLRIQVRWVLKTIKKTRDDLDKWYRTEYKTDEQLYQDFLNQKLSKRHWESYLYDWRRQYEKYEEVRKLLPLARQAQRGLRSFKTQIISWSFQSLFEQKAIDVTLSVTVRFKYPSVYIGDRYYDDHDWTRGRQNLFAVYNSNQSWEYSIEIKPQLGDDYPAVLRQILASKK